MVENVALSPFLHKCMVQFESPILRQKLPRIRALEGPYEGDFLFDSAIFGARAS